MPFLIKKLLVLKSNMRALPVRFLFIQESMTDSVTEHDTTQGDRSDNDKYKEDMVIVVVYIEVLVQSINYIRVDKAK